MTATITRTAEQVAESAILRYVRLTTFHPAEETTALMAFGDALVMLEDLGAEAVINHRPTGDVETSAWRTCAMFCQRAMTLTRTVPVDAYFTPIHDDDCRCARCD